MRHLSLLPLLTPLACLTLLGCQEALSTDQASPTRTEQTQTRQVEKRQVRVARNVFLEVEGQKRRVQVLATVCLREGPLELLMCRRQTKEHEAVLTADVDARDVHKALLLTGAREGAPVRFTPRYRPASGQRIRVTLQYKDTDGKKVTVPGQSWVKSVKTGKALHSDWVFAGSRLVENPLNPGEKTYLANDGDVICISNFESALLDLPIESSKEDADRSFTAFTAHIPPLETPVTVILEPIPEPAKSSKTR